MNVNLIKNCLLKNPTKILRYLVLVMGILPSCCLLSSEFSIFVVEHARTEEQMQWGLMQRRFLPENHGMLFHYSHPQKVNFWSFNCYIDLSVAFIDEKRVIREIKPLKACSKKMDPSRPVFSSRDFSFYPALDPIFVFFEKASISSSVPVKYVLEMNLGWFERNRVRVGDVLCWDDRSNVAFFN